MTLKTNSVPQHWVQLPLEQVCEIFDSMRVPVNNSERSKRIAGKSDEQLYPYYGATGQVGVIDDYIFDGEHVLLGEDGAPFLEPFKDKAYLALLIHGTEGIERRV
jgi:type I restriction enzyme S subunit